MGILLGMDSLRNHHTLRDGYTVQLADRPSAAVRMEGLNREYALRASTGASGSRRRTSRRPRLTPRLLGAIAANLLLHLARPQPGDVVLDCMTGTGTVNGEAAASFPVFSLGSDMNEPAIKRANAVRGLHPSPFYWLQSVTDTGLRCAVGRCSAGPVRASGPTPPASCPTLPWPTRPASPTAAPPSTAAWSSCPSASAAGSLQPSPQYVASTSCACAGTLPPAGIAHATPPPHPPRQLYTKFTRDMARVVRPGGRAGACSMRPSTTLHALTD